MKRGSKTSRQRRKERLENHLFNLLFVTNNNEESHMLITHSQKQAKNKLY